MRYLGFSRVAILDTRRQRFQDSGFGIRDSRVGIQDSGFGIRDSVLRVVGFGFQVPGS